MTTLRAPRSARPPGPSRAPRPAGANVHSPNRPPGTPPGVASCRPADPSAVLPLVLAGLSVMATAGVLYAGPVYRAAAAADLGWSLTLAAGSFAVGYLAAIPTGVLAGLAADRHGPRPVLLAAVLLAALGLVGASVAREPSHWYLSTGVALATAYYAALPAALVIAGSTGRRGTVLGLVVGLGCGGGLALGPTVAQLLIDGFGWRAAFGLQAGLLLLLTAAWTRVAVPPPVASPAAADTGEEAVGGAPHGTRHRLTALLFVGNALIAVFDEVVYQFAYPYALALGLSGVAAAGLLTATSVGFTAGMVGGGALSDRLGRSRVLLLAALGVAIALAGLCLATPTTVWPWGVAFGTALGATITARSALWADLFAGPRLGRSVGILAAGYPIGAAATTLGGAAWLDAGGPFAHLFLAGTVAACAWAGVILVASEVRAGVRRTVR